MANQEILVELVSEGGEAIGTMEKQAAHIPPGVLHRAFSLFAFDAEDRLILQRRAAEKYHSPLLLTNSVCSHPNPGEAPADAVRRRAVDELRADVADLTEVGTVRYNRFDERSGLVEQEFNHTFIGRMIGEIEPNPDEVDELIYVNAAELDELRTKEPFTVWFDDVFALIAPKLGSFVPGFGVSKSGTPEAGIK